MSSEDLILSERHDDVAVLRLNLPQRLNPLAIPLQQRLREALAGLRDDRGVRALVLTGAGKAFCVGADLSGLTPPADRPLGDFVGDTMESLSNRIVEDLRELPFPVVSAVNGPCAGAGVGVALAADLVIAARSAYFYLPFLPRLGIVPDLGTTWFLERYLGRARAVGLALLGDRLGAEQAVQWGLIWSCVDDDALMAEALGLARRLARLPAHAAMESRRVFDSASSRSLLDQMRFEADRQRDLIGRPEFTEGARAFIEKREPVFPPR